MCIFINIKLKYLKILITKIKKEFLKVQKNYITIINIIKFKKIPNLEI